METKSVKEGDLLWEPSKDLINESNVTKYMNWLKDEKGLNFGGYHDLWEWSVTELEKFWESIWEFYEIKASKPYTEVLSERKMPGAN